MKKVGFIKSKKENENRRAIILSDIKKIKNKKSLFFEKGYGDILGFSDDELKKIGCNIDSRENILKKCEIICDPKIGDAEYLENLNGQTIFGWVHATQNYDITQKLLDNKLTAYAWEKMYEGTRHVFYKNNEIAGETAVLHAMLNFGKNFTGLDVAILGNGNSAKGAIKIFNQIGANVTVYNHSKEDLFKNEFYKYDVIVNCVLWDVSRKNHIIYKEDLLKMKKDSIIIDISCDKGGAIETSVPTTIKNPIYTINNVVHYVADHTPTLLYKDASKSISKEVCKYIDCLIENDNNTILKDALIIRNGKILDKEIIKFQNRK